MSPQPRVMFVTTSDMTMAIHVDGLAGYLTQAGFDVALCSDDSGRLRDVAARNGARAVAVRMARNPSFRRDMASLLLLLLAIRRERPKTIVYGTPKAALLTSLASWLARVPVRVHVLHGLRVETMTGIRRVVMLAMDRMTEALSTINLAVGHGLADQAVTTGSMHRRPVVLGDGSAQGVDFDAFPRRTEQRMLHGFCIGFVGRITADKGIDALCEAFERFGAEVPEARLRLVGAAEALGDLNARTQLMLATDPRVEMIGEVSDVHTHMQHMSLLCLPTRREGLPTILLEAAAMGVPIIASTATGVSDVVDSRSAWLVPVDDVSALAGALREAYKDEEQRAIRAERAFLMTRDRFERNAVWERWREFLVAVAPGERGSGGSRIETQDGGPS